MDLDLTAIIPTTGRTDPLGRALQSFLHQTETNFEIILVSQEGPLRCDPPIEEVVAREEFRNLNLRLIRSPIVNASHARNLGISASRAPILLFLDDDIMFTTPESIAAHLRNYSDSSIPG